MEIEKILESDFLTRISFFNFENAITAAFYTDQNLNLNQVDLKWIQIGVKIPKILI